MSWDSYIDNLMGQTKDNCDRVCIIGLDGGAAWTSAHGGLGIIPQGNEAVNIANVLKTWNLDCFRASGIYLEGKKYMFLRDQDDNLVLGKLKDNGAITIEKTNTAIVIAHTKEGGNQGDTNTGVKFITDYLKSMNM